MTEIATNAFRVGMKIEVDGQPYTIVSNQFVKPGKGQAFNRVRIKHLLSGRVIDKSFRSGETVRLADVEEMQMRVLYSDNLGVSFINDDSYEQMTISWEVIGDVKQWLVEDLLYAIVFYRGEPVIIEPPMFMELEIVETSIGLRGDSSSGRVLKPATLSTGAVIQVPIFLDMGEIIKVDTRTGEYVARVSKTKPID